MSEGKHTPGPWWLAGKATIRWGNPNTHLTGWIASVSWRNREANARLITAAPELLAAAQLAESALTSAGGWEGSLTLLDLRAAIAKAEDSQP